VFRGEEKHVQPQFVSEHPCPAGGPVADGDVEVLRARHRPRQDLDRRLGGSEDRRSRGERGVRVYKLGAGAARAFGSIRERIPGSGGPAVTQGVSVEVGERQAAIDLALVVEYGVSILDLTSAVRRNVLTSVERMTGLEVTEVNIAVDDVHLPTDDDQDEAPEPSRVR